MCTLLFQIILYGPDAGEHHVHNNRDTKTLQSIAEALHLRGFGHEHDHWLAQDTALYDNNLAIHTVILALVRRNDYLATCTLCCQ